MKITLDAETFKALASPTRLGVLRALDERRKTLTELARDMALNKATVHEHLALLTAASLIRKRDDEGRKWIYYELTWRGQKLLHPQESTTFNVLLGVAVASAGGGMAMLGRSLGWWLQDKAAVIQTTTGSDEPITPRPAAQGAASSSSGTGSGTAAATDASTAASPIDATQHDFLDDGGWIALGLVSAALVAAGAAWWRRRSLQPKPFTPPEGLPPGS